jgi:hypothetical protein
VKLRPTFQHPMIFFFMLSINCKTYLRELELFFDFSSFRLS